MSTSHYWPCAKKYIEDTLHVNSGNSGRSFPKLKAKNLCREEMVLVRFVKLLQSLEPCKNLRREGGLGHNRIEYSVDVEGRFLSGVYLRGLWCCTHRLRVGCAVVGGLLAVVLRPGSAVVWLASWLGGCRCCCRCCGLRGRLTWREKQQRAHWCAGQSPEVFKILR